MKPAGPGDRYVARTLCGTAENGPPTHGARVAAGGELPLASRPARHTTSSHRPLLSRPEIPRETSSYAAPRLIFASSPPMVRSACAPAVLVSRFSFWMFTRPPFQDQPAFG